MKTKRRLSTTAINYVHVEALANRTFHVASVLKLNAFVSSIVTREVVMISLSISRLVTEKKDNGIIRNNNLEILFYNDLNLRMKLII